jgi:large conductance mechanosensitive channel
MGILHEFKAFAIKGNVIDLAVGVVIGGAFTKIINSIVDDLITPALLSPVLTAAHLTELSGLKIPGTAIKYGNFLSTLLSFMIVAFVLFLIIKAINNYREKQAEKPAEPTAPTATEKLLMEIRDLLKK